MPIGAPKPGTATGPNIGPRNVTGQPFNDLPDLAGTALAHHLVVIDHQSIALQSVADADGVATAQLEAVSQGLAYLVQRMSIKSTSVSVGTCSVYIGSSGSVGNRIDFSTKGNNDIADLAPPIFVPGGQALVLEWEGQVAEAICTARVQYQVCTFLDVPITALIGEG